MTQELMTSLYWPGRYLVYVDLYVFGRIGYSLSSYPANCYYANFTSSGRITKTGVSIPSLFFNIPSLGQGLDIYFFRIFIEDLRHLGSNGCALTFRLLKNDAILGPSLSLWHTLTNS
jgi:hypothetical protein